MKPRVAALTLLTIASSFFAPLAGFAYTDDSSSSDQTTSDQTTGQSPGIAGQMSRQIGGQRTDQIQRVQQALKDKGLDPGPVDGTLGQKTHAALQTFQKEQGLRTTGTLDAPTLAALGVSSSRQSAGEMGGTRGMHSGTPSTGSDTSTESDTGSATQSSTSQGMGSSNTGGDTAAMSPSGTPQTNASSTPSYGSARGGTGSGTDTSG